MKINLLGVLRRMSLTILFGVSMVLLYSCVDKEDFDLDKLAGVEWEGAYALPVLNSSLTIKDILSEEDSSRLKQESDGLLYFEYNEKVLNYNIRDEFEIPSRSFSKDYSLPEIKLPTLDNSLNLSLQQMTGRTTSVTPFPAIPQATPNPNTFNFPPFSDIVYVKFSQGTLEFLVKNNAKAPLTFTANLSNADNTPITGSLSFTVGVGAEVKKQISLANVTIRKEIKLTLTNVSATATTNTLNPADIIEFKTQILSSPIAKASEGEIILQEDVKISANESLNFEFDTEQIHEILFKEGSLNYSINSSLQNSAEASLFFPTFQKSGAPLTQTITIGASGQVENSSNLADYNADLTTVSPAYNHFPLQIEVVCKKSATPFKWKLTDKVSVHVSMNQLQFKHLKGFFGSKTVPLEENTFNINAFDEFLKGTNIALQDPSISFNVHNDYGIPLTLNFKKFQAANEDEFKNIITKPASPFLLLSPAAFGDPATQTLVEIDNPGDIYDLNPSSITYQLDATLNKGETSGNNFLTDTSKVIVEMNAKIPLWGRAGNILLEDTIDNSLEGDIDEVKISYVKLKAMIENQFPIDATVQIYFADDNYKVTDSLFTKEQSAILPSSTVTENGDLVKSGVYDNTIDVNKEKFERLLKSPYLIIRGNLSTANKGGSDVKIKGNYKLDVKLGLQTKLDVKVKL